MKKELAGSPQQLKWLGATRRDSAVLPEAAQEAHAAIMAYLNKAGPCEATSAKLERGALQRRLMIPVGPGSRFARSTKAALEQMRDAVRKATGDPSAILVRPIALVSLPGCGK